MPTQFTPNTSIPITHQELSSIYIMTRNKRVNNPLDHPSDSGLTTVYDPIELFNDDPIEPKTIFRGHRDTKHGSFIPDFDLRETADAYYLEGEFPGISGRESINLKWINGSTLHIHSHIDRVEIGDEWDTLENITADDDCSIYRDDFGQDENSSTTSSSSMSSCISQSSNHRKWLFVSPAPFLTSLRTTSQRDGSQQASGTSMMLDLWAIFMIL